MALANPYSHDFVEFTVVPVYLHDLYPHDLHSHDLLPYDLYRYAQINTIYIYATKPHTFYNYIPYNLGPHDLHLHN